MQQHIIIVGGGVIGASSAYFLSKYPSCRITLIEKTEIACGASGKSGGFLALDWSDSHHGMKALSRASYQLHRDLAKELSGYQAYGYRTMNTYSVVFDTDKTNKKRKPVKSDIAWIHQQHVRSFEQMGTTETTAQVTPPLFTQTLVDAAVKTGRVEVKVGQGVSEVLFEDQKAVGVELENGETLHGDHVVVCMGPWSGQLKLKQKIPVHGSHVHSIVLKPEDPTIPNQAIFTAILDRDTTAEPEVYPRPDGTVYLCGAADKEPLPESADLVKIDQDAIDLLIRQASIVSPQLTNVPLLKSQACYLPISSKTDVPLIGPHPAYSHLFLATGHSCWGILNAPITGKIVAEWLMDGQVSCLSPQEISFFVPEYTISGNKLHAERKIALPENKNCTLVQRKGSYVRWSDKIAHVQYLSAEYNLQITSIVIYDNNLYNDTQFISESTDDAAYPTFTDPLPPYRDIQFMTEENTLDLGSTSVAVYFVPLSYIQFLNQTLIQRKFEPNGTRQVYTQLTSSLSEHHFPPSNTTKTNENDAWNREREKRNHIIYAFTAGVVLILVFFVTRWCLAYRIQEDQVERGESLLLRDIRDHVIAFDDLEHLCPILRYGDTSMTNTVCAICLDEFLPEFLVRVLPCHHGYCTVCIGNWHTCK